MSRWLKTGLIASAVSGLTAAIVTVRRRNRVSYPPPESLVLYPDDDWRERAVTLEGVANCRDIGGYRTEDGRTVRRGMVYRSGAMTGLTAGDLERVAGLGLRLVCDLRTEREVMAVPDQLPAHPTPHYVQLPMDGEDGRERSRRFRALLFNRRALGSIMPDVYTRMLLVKHAAEFGRVLRLIAQEEHLPALVHCTAGKDRTGLAIALLLRALGVDEETVVADYSLSNLHYRTFFSYGDQMLDRLKWLGLRARHIQPLLVADPATLRYSLKFIETHYGTVEGYLLGPAGLDQATLDRLKALLLE